MSKINVVDQNGRVVSIDEDTVESDEKYGVDSGEIGAAGEQEQRRLQRREKNYGGTAGALVSGALGAADALTAGGVGLAFRAAGQGQAYGDIAEEHPEARTAGSIGAFLVPGLGELGAGGQVARGARALGAGTGLARAAEGVAYGIGGHIAQSNVDGSDPFTVEALTAGAIGGVINYGVGALGDRLIGAGKAARESIEADAAGDTASELFAAPHPAYDALRDAADSEAGNADAVNKGVAQRLERLDKYADSTEKYADDINDYDGLLRKQLMADINRARSAAVAVEVPATGTPPELAALNEKLGVPSDPYVPASRHLEPGAPPNKWERGVTLKEATEVLDNGLKTVKAASDLRYEGPDGIKRGVEMLRPLREGLAERFHYAVPDLPEPPGLTVPALDGLRGLPKDLEGFARMDPAKAAAFSSQITPNVEMALKGLMSELRLLPSGSASGTFADLQGQLAGHAGAMDAIAAGATGPSNSILVRTLKWITRRGVRAAGGAAVGAVLPVPGAALAGAAMAGFSHTVAASALQSGAVVRTAIRKMVAEYAGGAGRGAIKLAPITSYLMSSFPSGKRDKSSSDIGVLAKNRLGDLAGITAVAPDTVYHAVQPLNDVPGGLGLGIHTKINSALRHTLQNVARDPGTAPRGTGSDWKPSPVQAISMAYRLEALQKPLDAIRRALGGDVHPDGIDALHANWPALVSATADELIGVDSGDLSPAKRRGMSALLGAPQSGLSVPANVIALQGMYLPGASQARQPQSQQSEQPGEPGRPPKAGRSTVAGSNVNSLITQG